MRAVRDPSRAARLFSRPGARFSNVPKAFRAIEKTPTRFFCEAGLSICCKGHKNLNDCKVLFLETPLFWRHKENYVTRKAFEKPRDFRETGSCSDTCHAGIFSCKNVSWPEIRLFKIILLDLVSFLGLLNLIFVVYLERLFQVKAMLSSRTALIYHLLRGAVAYGDLPNSLRHGFSCATLTNPKG